MIVTHIRFIRSVTLGNTEHEAWHISAPGVSRLTGLITPREVERGFIFECRVPRDHYDVEVPWANIAQVTRTVDEPATTVVAEDLATIVAEVRATEGKQTLLPTAAVEQQKAKK